MISWSVLRSFETSEMPLLWSFCIRSMEKKSNIASFLMKPTLLYIHFVFDFGQWKTSMSDIGHKHTVYLFLTVWHAFIVWFTDSDFIHKFVKLENTSFPHIIIWKWTFHCRKCLYRPMIHNDHLIATQIARSTMLQEFYGQMADIYYKMRNGFSYFLTMYSTVQLFQLVFPMYECSRFYIRA